MSGIIHRYTDIDDRWRWRLIDGDGHVIASGAETFDTEEGLADRLASLSGWVSDVPRHVVEGAVLYHDPVGDLLLIDEVGDVVTTGHTGRTPVSTSDDRRGVDTKRPVEVLDKADVDLQMAIDDVPIVVGDHGLFVCHRGHDGEWRWTWHLATGPVCESGEGYASVAHVTKHVQRFTGLLPTAEVRTWG